MKFKAREMKFKAREKKKARESRARRCRDDKTDDTRLFVRRGSTPVRFVNGVMCDNTTRGGSRARGAATNVS